MDYTYGFEVETDDFERATFFPLSHQDGSGPREYASGVHADPAGIIREIAPLHCAIAGISINECHNGLARTCGNHVHLGVPNGTEMVFYDALRHLIPFFAPFFAGTPLKTRTEQFRLRSERDWFGVPNQLDQTEWNTWRDRRNWWVTPHKCRGMAIHFEIRINEAPPTYAFTPLVIIQRIVEAFIASNYHPEWSDDLLQLGRRMVETDTVTRIDQLAAIVTDDLRTAEILTSVLHTPVSATEPITLTAFLSGSIAMLPYYSYPIIIATLAGDTWCKRVTEAVTPDDRIAITQAALAV